MQPSPDRYAGRAEHYPLSVAPMMDRTDRYFRFFMRQLTKRTLLYTEMITTGAIIHGDRDLLLGYDDIEHPLALQVGGDDPAALKTSARVAEDLGYDEIDLNVGCPSDRVQSGRFGACLMARPEQVADCIAAMRAEVKIPVTVKHRIGIDEQDSYEDLARFVEVVRGSGADRFIVHARKAFLQGLNPKQNRTVPPLRYDDVHRLKAENPDLCIEINGGIRTLEAAAQQLRHVDGVMIGRAAYEDPYIFATADRALFGEPDAIDPTRQQVIEACAEEASRMVAEGGRLHRLARHLLPMFAGRPGGRAFRRHISEHASREGAGGDVLLGALEAMRQARPLMSKSA